MNDNYVINVALLERLKVADLRLKTGELDPFIRTYQECYAWTDYIKNRFIIIFIFFNIWIIFLDCMVYGLTLKKLKRWTEPKNKLNIKHKIHILILIKNIHFTNVEKTRLQKKIKHCELYWMGVPIVKTI